MNKYRIISATYVGALVLVAGPGRADTTVVLNLKTASVQQGDSVPHVPSPGAYKIQFHLGLARTEGPDGVVKLFDYDHDKVTTLNPVLKTFSIQSRRDFFTEPNKGRLDIHTSVDFRTQEGGDAVFVGINGILYHIRATLTAEAPSTQPPPGTGRRRGGSFPGGGFPGGGTGGGQADNAGIFSSGSQIPGLPGGSTPQAGSRVFEGDAWIASGTAFKLPPKADALPWLSCIFPRGSVLGSLTDAFRRVHSAPLMMSVLMPPTPEESAFRVTAEVQSVDNSDLPDSTFVIPADYTKTDPPKSTAK